MNILPKFFINLENFELKQNNAYIDNTEDIQHIVKVLRKNIGDIIELCDGYWDYSARITEISKNIIRLEILNKDKNNRESNINIILFQCLIKSAKMDFVIQKATELGVKKIVPVDSQRVVIDLSEKENKKIERWTKIAKEAQKQCQRPVNPEIIKSIELSKIESFLDELDILIVPYEKSNNIRLKDILANKQYKNIGILIGPEGGFEQQEIDRLSIYNDKVKIVSLGNRILRAETAAISTISIIQALLGDM
ncbi:16S rRNA (uracil(1498)-N(3))-methyltransferase [Caldicellulosiruptoraceae bacterium PP1]